MYTVSMHVVVPVSKSIHPATNLTSVLLAWFPAPPTQIIQRWIWFCGPASTCEKMWQTNPSQHCMMWGLGAEMHGKETEVKFVAGLGDTSQPISKSTLGDMTHESMNVATRHCIHILRWFCSEASSESSIFCYMGLGWCGMPATADCIPCSLRA
mgnify:CR=1 FL=1